MKKSVRFLFFIFEPLFTNGRWLIWFFALLLLMMMANTITAIRMEIPSQEQVIRINGKFIDTGKGYKRGVLFNIGIVDASGFIHYCNCEPLGYSNCLGRHHRDHAEIRDQLDAEVVKNYALQKAMVKWLAGKEGEVWMYPNQSVFGPRNSCYQISDSTRIHRTFKKSVDEYTSVKNGIDVYLFWLIALFGALAMSAFIAARIKIYLEENK